MAWENEIQVPFTFFVFAWHWKTDLNFAFCFSFSANFENWIWTSSFIFRFCITLKNGIWISFLVYAFLWKTDLNFVSRFRITLKNGFEFRFSFLYGLLLKNRSESCLSFLHVLKNGRITTVSLCKTSLVVVERIGYSLNLMSGFLASSKEH